MPQPSIGRCPMFNDVTTPPIHPWGSLPTLCVSGSSSPHGAVPLWSPSSQRSAVSPVQLPSKPRPSTSFYIRAADTKIENPTFRPSSRPRTGLLVGRQEWAAKEQIPKRSPGPSLSTGQIHVGSAEGREIKEDPTDGDDSTIQSGYIVEGRLEGYVLEKRLQDCLYGGVFDGTGKLSGDRVAVKILSKNKIRAKQRDAELPETPLAEVFFSLLLRGHKNVFSVREAIETRNFHFVVSDLAIGEDLLELLKSHPGGVYEDQAKTFIKQAAEALNFCHRKHVAMQDFSLENCLLFIDQSESLEVRVCDPGQAVVFDVDSLGNELPVSYKGCVGKRFRPPEIFTQKPYIASKVDAWCLGWSTFYFLFATEIFESVYVGDGDVRWRLIEDNRGTELLAQLGVLGRMSQNARNFLLQLLLPDPSKRMSIAEALSHPFLSDAKSQVTIDDLQSASLRKKFRKRLDACRASTGTQIPKKRPVIPSAYFKYHLARFCSMSKPSSSLIPWIPELTRTKSKTPDNRKKSGSSLHESQRVEDYIPNERQFIDQIKTAIKPKSLPRLAMSRIRSNLEQEPVLMSRQLAAGERPSPSSSKFIRMDTAYSRSELSPHLGQAISTPSIGPMSSSLQIHVSQARRRMSQNRNVESPRSSRHPLLSPHPFHNPSMHTIISGRRVLPDVTTCPNIVHDPSTFRDSIRSKPILNRADSLHGRSAGYPTGPDIPRPSVATLPSVHLQSRVHYRSLWSPLDPNYPPPRLITPSWATYSNITKSGGSPNGNYNGRMSSNMNSSPNALNRGLWSNAPNDQRVRSAIGSNLIRRRAIIDGRCPNDMNWAPTTRWHVTA